VKVSVVRWLPTQGLGLAVGAAAGVVATLAAVAVAVLIGSRDSKRSTPARPASRSHAIYTLRQGDVVRDPLTATRCEASREGGVPNLFCTRTAKGRHQIVFYKDAVLVFDLQDRTRDPLDPNFFFDWFTGKSSQALKPLVIRDVLTPLPCPKDPQTTVALEGCAERAILSTDRKINAQAKVIFRLLRSPRTRVTFDQGEEAWLEYRGSSCTAEASFYDGGSAQPVVNGNCIAARNRTHLRDLAAVKATLSQR
jgi:uncharacterized protein YecT (DUF1311 family)